MSFLRGLRPSGLPFTWLRASSSLYAALGAKPEGSGKTPPETFCWTLHGNTVNL